MKIILVNAGNRWLPPVVVMKGVLLHAALLISSSSFMSAAAPSAPAIEPYVVYMGSSMNGRSAGDTQAAHLQLLSSIIPSGEQNRVTLLQSYHHAFEGFSAMLTGEEAAALTGFEGVVSVFPDRLLELHTTRSWDFLESQSGLRHDHLSLRASKDVIIGIIDTGIWPESTSFSDAGMGEVPARWKGVCMEAPDFTKNNCNKKLIGARFYTNQAGLIAPLAANGSDERATATAGSPRDAVGHGTHTASTAAGAAVVGASYYGLAQGTARGGATNSRVAAYKACSLGGCAGSAVLKAIDDAVADGVDIISISIGTSAIFQSDYLSDPIAIGAFHAQQKGVMVVCSGGNDGPEPFTVVNSAPWIMTVAASNIDRNFQSTIALGNGAFLKGVAINFSNMSLSTEYPLAFGADVASDYTPISEASNCIPGSLDARKTAGKVVVCVGTNPSVSRKVKKLVAEGAGARGLILIDDVEKAEPFDSASFPFSQVGTDAGSLILAYINSTKNPTAVILGTENVDRFKPAPSVAYFSARGPGGLTEAILKPDVMAPGVGILAATIPSPDSDVVPTGQKPSGFAIKSGTSMACPHAAGAAAFVKAAHPGWSPSMIRSALMTTAVTKNNAGEPVRIGTGSMANWHDTGAGEVSPLRAISPGIVFETTTDDYLNFLCYYGYKDPVIRKVAGFNFSCPAVAVAPSPDLIAANVNYPTISVANLNARKTITVTRTVVNVGSNNSTYIATVDAPRGLTVIVSPDKLVFGKRGAQALYHVTFSDDGANKGYVYGALSWFDGAHYVRTAFAVNIM